MYGQRCGALLNVAATKEQSQEFYDVNQYTSRATWSNINRGAMQTLVTILQDEKLKADIMKERNQYYALIKERGDLFTKEAASLRTKDGSLHCRLLYLYSLHRSRCCLRYSPQG